MTESLEVEILVDEVNWLRQQVEDLRPKAKIGNLAEAKLAKKLESFNAKINELFELDPYRFTFKQDQKRGHEHLLWVTIDDGPKFRFPYEFLTGDNKKKVEKIMNSNVMLVNVPVDFSGNTKPMVEYNGRLLSLEDAKVIWTSELRTKAMDTLKAGRPDLYARYTLACVQTYRDAQRFCTFATKQSYCEVRGGYGSDTVLTIFGGNTGVPSDTDNLTPIPGVDGGFIYWFHRSMSAGGWSTGYETICRIVKPSNWQGDVAERQNWIDFVEINLNKVVSVLKWDEDQQKQYFDIRRIPNLSNCSTRLGYSELSYE